MFAVHHLSLGRQISLITLSLSLVIFGSLIAFVSVETNRIAIAQTETLLHEHVRGVVDFLESDYRINLRSVQEKLHLFQSTLPGKLVVTHDTMTVGEKTGVRVMKSADVIMNGDIDVLRGFKEKTAVELV